MMDFVIISIVDSESVRCHYVDLMKSMIFLIYIDKQDTAASAQWSVDLTKLLALHKSLLFEYIILI